MVPAGVERAGGWAAWVWVGVPPVKVPRLVCQRVRAAFLRRISCGRGGKGLPLRSRRAGWSVAYHESERSPSSLKGTPLFFPKWI